MKNHLLLIGSLLALGIVFAGCEMPEKISVKTQAEYQVPLGTLDLSSKVTGVVSSDKILETVQSTLGETASVYEYQDGSDVLSYLVRYPLPQSISFDVGSVIGNLNIDSMLGGTTGGLNIDQSITLPELKKELTKTLAVGSIADSILQSAKDQISANSGLISSAFNSIPEPGDLMAPVSVTDSLGSITINSAFADSIKYSNNSKLVIKLVKADSLAPTGDFTFKIKAVIKDSTNAIYSQTAEQDIAGSAAGDEFTFELPLYNGVSNLPANFKVAFSGSYGGGTTGTFHSYTASVVMTDETAIDAIYGVHPEGDPADPSDDLALSPISFGPVEQDLGTLAASLGSATVAPNGGELTIKANAPAGWTGVSVVVDNFTVDGLGLSLDTSDLTDVTGSGYLINKKLDFSNKTLAPTETDTKITVEGEARISIADGANIVIAGVDDIEADVKFELRKLSSATINLESLGVSAIAPIETTLPGSYANIIKEISFGTAGYKHTQKDTLTGAVPCDGIGLACKVVNSFPAGSDFSLTISSDFFNLNGANKIVAEINGTGSETPADVKWHAWPTIKMDEKTPTAEGDYTVDVAVDLPTSLTVKNIEMGETYKFGISDVQMLCDWDYISADLSSFNVNTEMELPGLGGLTASLPVDVSNINLDKLPMYFYASKPTSAALTDIIGNISINGSIDLVEYDYTYDADGNVVSSTAGETVDLLEGQTLAFVDAVTWPSTETVKVISTTSDDPAVKHVLGKLRKEDEDGNRVSSFAYDVATVINKKPDAMVLKPNIHIEGDKGTAVTLYAFQLDSVAADETLDVSLDLAILVPLKLNLDGYIKGKDSEGNVTEGIDIMSFMSGSGSGDPDPDPDPAAGSDPAAGADPDAGADPAAGAGGESSSSEPAVADLLNRTSLDTYGDYVDLVDSIKYFKLKYSLKNTLVSGLKIKIVIDDTHTGETLDPGVKYSGLKKEIIIDGDGQTREIKLTSNEIKSILSNYFYPSVMVYVGEKDTVTPIYISSSALASGENIFGIKIAMYMKVDEENPICLWAQDGSGIIKTDGSEGGE